MNENILDAKANSLEFSLYEILKWWEKKRPFYVFIILIVQIGLMGTMWEETISFGLFDAVLGSLGHLIVANIIYSVGEIFELISCYYLGSNKYLKKIRIALFYLGVLFSILITYKFYYNALWYYN